MVRPIRVTLSGKPSTTNTVALKVIGKWKSRHDGLGMLHVRARRAEKKSVLDIALENHHA